MKVNKTIQHDTNLVLGGFEDYYSNLAGNLLKKLPNPPYKFTLNTVFQHSVVELKLFRQFPNGQITSKSNLPSGILTC